MPHWLALPYFRPPLVAGEPGGRRRTRGRGEKMVSVEDVQTDGEKKVVEAEEERMKETRARSPTARGWLMRALGRRSSWMPRWGLG